MKHLKNNFDRNVVECEKLLTHNMICRFDDERFPINLKSYYIRQRYKLIVGQEPKIYSY